MFEMRLRHGGHTRHYSITSSDDSGWEVRLQEDQTVRRYNRYRDWHRVERALVQFELEVLELRELGWQDAN
jgi:hypothetical protein